MIKKIFFSFILSVIFLCTFLMASVAAYDATIANISAVAESEDSTTATVEFDLTNNTTIDKEFDFFIAIYTKDNILHSIKKSDETILAGNSERISDEISVPSDKIGIYGKIFVWNIENLQPLADKKNFLIDISHEYEDVVITSNMTLENDVYYDNVILQSGTVNLNGHTMHVYGDLIQPGGKININNGKLLINKNYYIQGLDDNGDLLPNTDEGTSTGELIMTCENDYVLVVGNFLINSSRGSYFPSAQQENLIAGTIEFKGDFHQYGKSQYSYFASNNFGTGGTHKTIFSGVKRQTIYFDNSIYSYFTDLELKNNDINVESYINGWTLHNDTTINSDLAFNSNSLNLNGYNLTVNGNVTQAGDCILSGGTFIVNGDYTQPDGTMSIDGGSLIIYGNYRIQEENENGYDYSYGKLVMSDENDYVFVNGDFYTQSHYADENVYIAGTMEFKGNFYQLCNDYNFSKYNFNASGSHNAIFSGNNNCVISFESTNSKFNNLIITQPLESYTFVNVTCNNLYCTYMDNSTRN